MLARVGKSCCILLASLAVADAMAATLAALTVSNDVGKGYAPGKWTRKDVTLNGAPAVTFTLEFKSARGGTILVR